MEEKAIPRQGMPIAGGGEVTSGTALALTDVGIGMGYVLRPGRGRQRVETCAATPGALRVVKKPIYRKEP